MAGYAPLFDSIATGTLYGKWPDIGVWPIIIALSDRHGVLDVTPQYLAGVTGLPLDEVIAVMKRFRDPDPHSRSQEANGARLELIDEHRDWGWIVVNKAKYREKARLMTKDAERTESGKDAERKRVTRQIPPESNVVQLRPPVSPALPLSDADADADADKRKTKTVRGATRPQPKSNRVPAEFVPDSEFALAELPDIDVAREIAKFRDCEFRVPRSDWKAAWRRWIRTCRDSGRYSRIQAGGRKWEA